MDFRDKLKYDRMAVFDSGKPADLPDELWEAAKIHAQTSGQKLPKDLEQSCFYYYVMGDSWKDIAIKLDVAGGILVYTGLCYEWPKKKAVMDNTQAGTKIKKAETAAADLIVDSIVATAAVYKHKLAEIIKNPEKAKDCPLIPRNIKEMQVLLQLLEVAQPKQPGVIQPGVSINIANVGGQAPKLTAATETLDLLPEADEPDPARLEVLKLLQKVKVT